VSPLAYVGLATAGLGLVVGAITGGVSLVKESNLKSECQNYVCTPDHEGDLNSAKALGDVSTVGFVVAGAGAVLAVVGFVLPSSAPGETARMPRPLVGPGFLGMEGQF